MHTRRQKSRGQCIAVGQRQSIAENKLIVLSNGGTSPNISECNRGGVRALREPGKKTGKIQSDGRGGGGRAEKENENERR